MMGIRAAQEDGLLPRQSLDEINGLSMPSNRYRTSKKDGFIL